MEKIENLKQNYKGHKWDKLSSHIDITPTILLQLGHDNTAYNFGRDIFNKEQKAFVPYAFPKGYGLISKQGYYAFSESYNKVFESHALTLEREKDIKRKAELFFQSAFKKYMDL